MPLITPTPNAWRGVGIGAFVDHALGGHNGANALSKVEAYDPASDSWTEVVPLPTPRTAGAGVVNGVLYAVGGYDYSAGTALSVNEAFTLMSPGTAQLSGAETPSVAIRQSAVT